jgi:hypothetical protein
MNEEIEGPSSARQRRPKTTTYVSFPKSCGLMSSTLTETSPIRINSSAIRFPVINHFTGKFDCKENIFVAITMIYQRISQVVCERDRPLITSSSLIGVLPPGDGVSRGG